LVEDSRAEEERRSRIWEFDLRARNLGITKEMLVAQKVAILEGMRDAKRNGDDAGVSIHYSAPFLRCSEIVANSDWGSLQYYAAVLLDAATGAGQ